MRAARASGFVMAGVIAIALMACANGGDAAVDTNPSGGGGGGVRADDAGADVTTELVVDSGDTIIEAAAIDSPNSTLNNDSSTGGEDSSSNEPEDSGSNAASCDATNTCGTATMVMGIDGDNNGPTVTVNGITSQFVNIRMTEYHNESPFAYPMKLRATLTSSADALFSLYVYYDPSMDSPVDCSTPVAQSASGGPNNSIDTEWGETGEEANDSDDSRNVIVEVRYESGTCSPNNEWTLKLTGNM